VIARNVKRHALSGTRGRGGAIKCNAATWCRACNPRRWVSLKQCAEDGNGVRELLQPLFAAAEWNAERLMLSRITTGAESDKEAAWCERGDGGDRLCHECWMALGDIEHQRADAECRVSSECCGGECQRLKDGTLWRAAPHYVIPNPDTCDRQLR
jgi:hypothetical protein